MSNNVNNCCILAHIYLSVLRSVCPAGNTQVILVLSQACTFSLHTPHPPPHTQTHIDTHTPPSQCIILFLLSLCAHCATVYCEHGR